MPYTSFIRTSQAFLWNRALGIPFWALINILSCILYKDLHISVLHVTMIAALKPMSALLAPYWSMEVYQRRDRLLQNLMWGNLLRYLPFLFCPWMTAAWQVIMAFCLYMVFSRGTTPAWMEMIKCNIPETERNRVFQIGNTLEYIGMAVIPFFLGKLLDTDTLPWKWMFLATAVMGMCSTFFIFMIPPFSKETEHFSADIQGNQLFTPLRRSFKLLASRLDFKHYLFGFMLGGTGLMILHPVLSIYFVDVLDLSYTEMLMAISMCKGIGFALSSPFWLRFLRSVDIYFFSSLVAFLAALFPLILMGAHLNIACLYVAFILYGLMQSGSELSWHMSGPIFAGKEDSSVFSSTNILATGLRGSIVPYAGGLLFALTNSMCVMLTGALLCLLGSAYLYRYRNVLVPSPEPATGE